MLDSLFDTRTDFKLDEFDIIPFSDGVKFEMDAKMINKGGVMVPAFMAVAKKEYYLNGLDENMIKTL